jgi:thioredoxin 1
MTNSAFIDEVTERSFSQRVLRSELPVMIVACADSSAGERGFLKLVEEWAPQARGRLRILRLDVERSLRLAERFGVPSAPSLVLFSQGVVCYQFTGEVSRGELDELLARARLLGLAREPEAPGDRRPAVGPLRPENVTP